MDSFIALRTEMTKPGMLTRPQVPIRPRQLNAKDRPRSRPCSPKARPRLKPQLDQANSCSIKHTSLYVTIYIVFIYINLKILRKSDTDNTDSFMPVYNKNVTVTVNLNNTDTYLFIIHDRTHVDRRRRRRFLDMWPNLPN